MIIPFNKQQDQMGLGAPAQQMPSETNLLMALAAMHDAGRFDQKPDDQQTVTKFPKRPHR